MKTNSGFMVSTVLGFNQAVCQSGKDSVLFIYLQSEREREDKRAL